MDLHLHHLILVEKFDIEYPTATANYGTVVAVGILDALSGGNLLAYSTLDSSKVVSSGDVFRFNAGDLDITLA